MGHRIESFDAGSIPYDRRMQQSALSALQLFVSMVTLTINNKRNEFIRTLLLRFHFFSMRIALQYELLFFLATDRFIRPNCSFRHALRVASSCLHYQMD